MFCRQSLPAADWWRAPVAKHGARAMAVWYGCAAILTVRTRFMPPQEVPFILGWEEWVALPELGLPAIKAKVDTGARTSALHAVFVEPFGPARNQKVRFGVHPIPRRDDIEIVCLARVVDRRQVTSSNGEREIRYVISTQIQIGERAWPIEVTLTNRDAMSYRMLLGRQAIAEGILVDPAASFRQPRLRYKLYRAGARR
jgi:ribosomal protein S6--L-glutamate ligase